MFGCSPCVYKDVEATKMAAAAYQMEEQEPWMVVVKVNKDTGTIYYKPCRNSDISQALNEGYVEIDE